MRVLRHWKKQNFNLKPENYKTVKLAALCGIIGTLDKKNMNV